MTFDLLQIYPLLKFNQFKQFLHCISKNINTVHVFLKMSKCIRFECLTFKKRTYFLPACYASLFGVLPQRGLQEEEGDATGEQEQHIRNEEHTLEKQTSGRSCLNVQCKACIKTNKELKLNKESNPVVVKSCQLYQVQITNHYLWHNLFQA